jgi:hypothetical protein
MRNPIYGLPVSWLSAVLYPIVDRHLLKNFFQPVEKNILCLQALRARLRVKTHFSAYRFPCLRLLFIKIFVVGCQRPGVQHGP